MFWPLRIAVWLLLPALLFWPTVSRGQSISFGSGTAEVVSEHKAQDRGDATGSYELVTRVARGGMVIEHTLRIERDVYGDMTDVETMRVLEGNAVRATAASDPAALGGWAEAVVSWAIPFAVDFDGEPRRNYRAQDRKVKEVVRSVVPDASVNTRAGSDGRITAVVEIPGEKPVDGLAADFVGIRRALQDADVNPSRLRISGKATSPGPQASAE